MRCTMRIGLHTPGIIYSCGPEMMTHLWPKSQFKDADLNITSGCLINAVGFPLARTPNYLGPWMARRTSKVSTCMQGRA